MLMHYLHIRLGPVIPSVHALCPLGGLENLWSWVAGKANIQKIFSGTMTLFFFMITFTLIFGRAFCGNICPFGALQEFIFKIRKVFKINFYIPKKIDGILRYLKYIILIFVTLMAWITASIWISPYDPYTAFAHIWTGKELFNEMPVGFIILIIILIASVFIDRFFCKYLCPAGALYGIISKISLTKIKHKGCCCCSSCRLCSKICPMNIDVSESDIIRSAECISCALCAAECPSEKDCLKITIFGKKAKPLFLITAIVIIFFGSLFIFNRTGMLQITVPSLESVIESGNHLKIADLRGVMSIETGAQYVGMELSDFYLLMEIPETVPADTPLRNVSSFIPGWEFHVIRDSR